VPARSRDWRKIKCSQGQELVIGGWTAGHGARRRLGALLLGYWEGDRLRYAGKVGTGFDSAETERLADELERRERSTPPFADERLPRARWQHRSSSQRSPAPSGRMMGGSAIPATSVCVTTSPPARSFASGR
jgi:ATP-dependent DNA ligase